MQYTSQQGRYSQIRHFHLRELSPFPGFIDAPLSAQLLVERLYERGWCPHRVMNSCNGISHITLYYLSSLKRQNQIQYVHQDCTARECKAVTVPQISTHMTNNCHCLVLGPDMSRVKDLIADGEVPLIQLKTSLRGDLEVKVVKCAAYSRYTAKSHVVSNKHDLQLSVKFADCSCQWSDCQLGSITNSLPSCQLIYLNERIKTSNTNFGRGYWLFDRSLSWLSELAHQHRLRDYSSGGETLFWLDTFCIPNPDLEISDEAKNITNDIRKKAINMMDLVYTRASEVLVFDQEMQNIKGGAQLTPAKGEGILHTCVQPFVGPSDDRLTQTLAFVFGSNWYSSDAVLFQLLLLTSVYQDGQSLDSARGSASSQVPNPIRGLRP